MVKHPKVEEDYFWETLQMLEVPLMLLLGPYSTHTTAILLLCVT